MSASSEKILLQVIELEQQIQKEKSVGRDVSMLEEKLEILKIELTNLNEALTNPKSVLKG